MRFFSFMSSSVSILILLFTLANVAIAESKWKKISSELNRIKLNINQAEFPNTSHYRKNHYQGTRFYFGNNFKNNVGSNNVIQIWFYELASYHYENAVDLRDALSTWKKFKQRTNLITAEGTLPGNEITEFPYILFTSDNVPCGFASSTFGQSFHFGSSSGELRLNIIFCKKPGQTILPKEFDSLVKSIEVTDIFPRTMGSFTIGNQVSSQVRAKSQESESKFIAKENIDKESRLKEARDLFEKDLITRGQYEKMVNKILGVE